MWPAKVQPHPEPQTITCKISLADEGSCFTLDVMGSTYYSLHYHWICSTKERRPLIKQTWRSQFHQYLGGTVRGLAGVPLKIGGVEDHAHAVIGLKPTHCISDFVRELKKATSAWASDHHETDFAWQEGYTIFAVSKSVMNKVSAYIDCQEEHHRRHSFVEELKALLEKHGIQYDPKNLT